MFKDQIYFYNFKYWKLGNKNNKIKIIVHNEKSKNNQLSQFGFKVLNNNNALTCNCSK